MPIVIGLTAYAQSGKSEVSKCLCRDHGFANAKFAGPLKAASRAFFRSVGFNEQFIERMIEGDMKEARFPELQESSPREIMQFFGEGMRREFGENFHVDILFKTLLDSRKSGLNIVVDDIRYENEAAAIRALGGYIIKVERDGVGPVNRHVSENTVDADLIIHNCGSLEDLAADVGAALGQVRQWERAKGVSAA